MNAISVLNAAETVGAKEFRSRLPKILRHPTHAYRVMLQNKFSVAVLPDHQYAQILEMLQELQNAGLLGPVIERLQKESRKTNPWFWSQAWQKSHRASKADVKAGRTKRFSSIKALLKDLNK